MMTPQLQQGHDDDAATSASASGSQRRGRPGYDRETLVEICVDVFNRHGYDATSMGMLAAHLGISKSAIYHHVESKEAILESALDAALDALDDALAAVEAAPGTAVERVEESVRATLRVLLARMPAVTLLLRLRGNSELETRALERRRAITQRVAQLVAAAQAEGTVRDDVPPRAVARLMLGMVNSMVDWYRADADRDQQDTIRAVTSVVMGGLRG
ncbi:MAG: TetR/AcrR family transcriptional regulator [Micrococcus sp.]|nr:TetR/AcrR family transcriptional regulator [Micrococcus sp.]